MKILSIFTVIIILSGCSAGYFVQKSEKFKQKAISKGAKYEIPYKYITKTDTIIDTLNNTIEIRTFVIDSIPYQVDVPFYVPIGRQERKALRDSLKYSYKRHKADLRAYRDSLKQERIKHKQTEKTSRTKVRKENRSKWYMWLIIGLTLGVLLKYIIKRFLS